MAKRYFDVECEHCGSVLTVQLKPKHLGHVKLKCKECRKNTTTFRYRLTDLSQPLQQPAVETEISEVELDEEEADVEHVVVPAGHQALQGGGQPSAAPPPKITTPTYEEQISGYRPQQSSEVEIICTVCRSALTVQRSHLGQNLQCPVCTAQLPKSVDTASEVTCPSCHAVLRVRGITEPTLVTCPSCQREVVVK